MEKIRKKTQIKEMKEGEYVDDIFVVKIKKAIRPYSKGYSFSLILSDSTGASIEYKYWGGVSEENVKSVFDKIKDDSVLQVTGKTNVYNGKLEINADETCSVRVLQPDEYETEFVPASKKSMDLMYSLLLQKIDSVSNPEIKNLLNEILSEKGNALKKHPAAISIHHNWRGGLLEHILEVIEFIETANKLYPELDRNIMIAGAVLHDIGKLEELEVTTRIKGTQKGQLVGHLILGLNYLSKKLDNSKLDEVTKNKLLHLLASHHGKIEQGSPKEPMIPEALALYHSDDFSTKLTEMRNLIEQSKDSTQDDFMYSPRKKSNIFLR